MAPLIGIPWSDLDAALARGEFSDAERALLRYVRSVLSEEQAFAEAIFRALDTGAELARERLRAAFPELHAAWQSWKSGALPARVHAALQEGSR